MRLGRTAEFSAAPACRWSRRVHLYWYDQARQDLVRMGQDVSSATDEDMQHRGREAAIEAEAGGIDVQAMAQALEAGLSWPEVEDEGTAGEAVRGSTLCSRTISDQPLEWETCSQVAADGAEPPPSSHSRARGTLTRTGSLQPWDGVAWVLQLPNCAPRGQQMVLKGLSLKVPTRKGQLPGMQLGGLCTESFAFEVCLTSTPGAALAAWCRAKDMAEAYGEDWEAMDREERVEMAAMLLEHDDVTRESLSEVEGSEPLLMAALKTLRGLEEQGSESEVGAACWAACRLAHGSHSLHKGRRHNSSM